MKKKLLLSVIALVVCLVAAFTLTACNLEELLENADFTEDYSATDKEGSLELIEAFFAATLSDPDFVATWKNADGEIQLTETVKGTSSHSVTASGDETYAFMKGEHYYVASIYTIEDEGEEPRVQRTYFCSDSTKPGYYNDDDGSSDMADIYKGSVYQFMNKYYGVGLASTLPEMDGVTINCATHAEKKDGTLTGTLEFTYTSAGGTLTITASSEADKVKSVCITINDVAGGSATEYNWSFVYGGAVVNVPDTDAWDREEAEKISRIENNEKALSDRDEFLSSVFEAENVVITATKDLETLFTETIADDIDHIDYGTHHVYTYFKDVDGETLAYYVHTGAEDENWYMIDGEYFDDNQNVWYHLFIDIYDVVSSVADYDLSVTDNTMTFTVAMSGVTAATITATKENDVITAVTATSVGNDGSTSTVNMTFSYGGGSNTEPDLTGFQDMSASDEVTEDAE